MEATTQRKGQFKQPVSSAWLLIISEELPACIADNQALVLVTITFHNKENLHTESKERSEIFLFRDDKEKWAIE